MARQMTDFEKQLADHYNSLPPVEQRRLDTKLAQVKAAQVASPHAMFFLFPCLGTKTLKTKAPSNG